MALRRSRTLNCLLACLALVTAAPTAAQLSGTVAFAQDDLGNDWRRAQVAEVRRHLADHPGVDFVVTDAHGDPSLQALHIKRLARRGVDVLITSPADGRLLDPAIAQVHRNGVPVILLSRRIPSDAFTTFVHPRNRAITGRLARFMLKRLAGRGRILMLTGVPTATTTQIRSRVFLQAADRHPGISVTPRTANFLRSDAIRVVDEILEAQGGFPFDAIYAQSDSMAVGARMALRRADIDPGSLLIAGIDYIQEARAALRAGEQAVSYTYPTGGRQGAQLALRLLAGEEVPSEVILESVRVTPANADAIEPIF